MIISSASETSIYRRQATCWDCRQHGTASVWAWEPGTQQYKLSVKSGTGHSNIVSSIRFSLRDDFLVTTSHDNQLVFWSLSTGAELARVKVDK